MSEKIVQLRAPAPIYNKKIFLSYGKKYTLGQKFYFNTKISKSGCLGFVLDKREPEDITVNVRYGSHHNNLYGNVPRDAYLKLIESDHGIFEVLKYDCKMKIFFDIETYGEDKIEEAIEKIKSIIPDGELNICSNKRDTDKGKKFSYHVVVGNYAVEKMEDMMAIKIFCTIHKDLGFDYRVYTKNRLMRAINQSKNFDKKQDPTTILKYHSGSTDLKDHTITEFFKSDTIFVEIDPEPLLAKLDDPKERRMLGYKKYDLLSIPQQNYTLDFDIFELDNRKDYYGILCKIPNPERDIQGKFSLRHEDTAYIARWAYYHNITIEEFLSWLAQKDNSPARLDKWRKKYELTENYPKVTTDNLIYWLARFYPDIVKDNSLQKLQKTFEFKSDSQITGYLKAENFRINNKVVLCSLPMGAGKTTAVIDYLTGYNKVIFLSPRRSLAFNINERLKDKNFTLYTKGKINKADRIIVQVESLFKLEQNQKFDLVVIDEIESVLNQTLSRDTHKKNLELNFKILCNILKNAQKVIGLDAFTTTKSINFFEKLLSQTPYVYTQKEPPKERNLIELENFETMMANINEDLKNGKKLFIFYPFKTGSKNMPSIEFISESLKKYGNVLCYHSESNDTDTLLDVNKNWENTAAVITNSSITVGVNYDKSSFDNIYILWAPFVKSRDIIQSSYRVRSITGNVYLTKCKQGMKPISTREKFENETLDFLSQSNYIEDRAKSKYKCMLFFCEKAGYKLQQKETKIKEFKFEKDSCDDYFNYYKIEEYPFEQPKTLAEKLAVRKYIFKNLFLESTPEKILGEIWNNKKCNFFIKYNEFVNSENEFKDIITINLILPTNKEKVEIKEKKVDKTTNDTSNKRRIVKIMNEHFGMECYKYEYYSGKTKDGFWHETEDLIQYRRWALTYMKCVNEEKI